jgi:hypothetical protein
VRSELRKILGSTDNWKGEVWALQVTDASERTIQLRALMDAADANKAWDLRCYVRERLIQFLQQNYPESLPRFRADIRALESDRNGANHPSLTVPKLPGQDVMQGNRQDEPR